MLEIGSFFVFKVTRLLGCAAILAAAQPLKIVFVVVVVVLQPNQLLHKVF